MGAYINPIDETKEQWLEKNGTEVPFLDKWDIPENHFPVVLVDNGPFTAAGIAYCESELKAFINPEDWRPKRYFIVPIHRLHEVSPELERYMERG